MMFSWKIFFTAYFLSIISIIFSCKGQSHSGALFTKKEPVFSEVDTMETSADHAVLRRHDYFLVKGRFEAIEDIKKAIDSFVVKNSKSQSDRYNNYTMFFYEESPAVNEKNIKAREPDYRYRIFENNQESDFIVSYTYRNGRLSHVERSDKY